MKKIILLLAIFVFNFANSQISLRGKLINFNKAVIVVDSNSLGTPQFGTPTWIDYLTIKINNPNCVIYNFSVSGQSISEMLGDVNTQIDPLFQVGKTNVLIVHEMINERFFRRSATLAESIEKFKKYCLDRRKKGWKVIVITQYDTTYPCRQELLDFNVWLKTNWDGIANGIVDVWQEPIYRDATNPIYFPDGVHTGVNEPMAKLIYRRLIKIAK